MATKRVPQEALTNIDFDEYVLQANASVPHVVTATRLPNGRQDHWATGSYKGHGYGVIIDDDPIRRNPNRNIANILTATPPPDPLPKEHFYNIRAVLDQGPEHNDVGYAIRHWLTAAPLQSFLGPSALTIFQEARKIANMDERRRGTTLRSGMEVLKRRGHIDEFFYFTNSDDIRSWLLGHGAPIVMASIWTGGMESPANSYLTVSGPIIDRHAYVLMGWSDLQNGARILNSHGKSWCKDGRGWIRAHMLDFLLSDGAHAYSSPSKYIGVDAADNVAQRYLDETGQTGARRDPRTQTAHMIALDPKPSVHDQIDAARAAITSATSRKVIRHAIPTEDSDDDDGDTNAG